MSSVARKHRRLASRKCTFARATQALLADLKREQEQHEDINVWHAPSECHGLVAPHNPDAVLVELGRSLRWWTREAARRGLSPKWCYTFGLPYPHARRLAREA